MFLEDWIWFKIQTDIVNDFLTILGGAGGVVTTVTTVTWYTLWLTKTDGPSYSENSTNFNL